jgi:beta-lactamase class A
MEASRSHGITISLFVIGFALAFSAGYFVKGWSAPDTDGYRELHSGGFSFVSPLLECEGAESTKEVSLFEHRIQKILDEATERGDITEASVYFRDLNNGPWFGVNEGALFSPASLLKVPRMITYFKEAERDPSLLGKKIRYEPEADLDLMQNFVPEKKLEPGKEYTVEQLIEQMIVYSENNAKEILAEKDDRFADAIYKDLGMMVPGTGKLENFMSVKEYASFFRILYNASYLTPYYSDKALELLSRTDFREGLVAGVPQGVTVAHKFGERGIGDIKQLHDCGVIYERTHPYLLCVMTRGKDFGPLKQTIQAVSRETYSAVTSQ